MLNSGDGNNILFMYMLTVSNGLMIGFGSGLNTVYSANVVADFGVIDGGSSGANTFYDAGGNSGFYLVDFVGIVEAPLSASGLSLSGTEGTTLGGTLADFSDPNSFASTSDFSAVINWGDGNTSTGTIGFDSALNCFTVSGSHTYAQAGTYSPTVSIQDQGGATAAATATAVVADAPLSASGLSLSGTEGTTLGGTLADFSDPNSFASTSDFSAVINWGDGNTSTGTIGFDSALNFFTVSGSHTYAQAGTYSPIVSIQDQGGATAAATATAVVADAPLSASGLSLSGTEGTTLGGTLADFSDPNSFASTSDFSAVINWGDGNTSTGTIGFDSALSCFTVSGSHTYAQAGTYSPTVSIQDQGGATAAATATVAVADAPLSASGLSLSGTEGTTLGGTLADFSDPNSFASTSDFSAVINWGDGITSTGTIGFDSALNCFTVSGSHTYAQAGTYSPTVSIQDQGGATAAATATAAVADAPLSASGLSLSGTEGTTLGGTLVDFSDPNSFASTSDFSAVINWGDGITSTGTIGFDSALNCFTVSGSHTYAQAGTYSPTVSIQDQEGATAAATATAVVAVAPLSASGLSLSGTEGTTLGGTLADFSDPNSFASTSDFSAVINWGDGNTSTGTIGFDSALNCFTVSGSHTYTQAGTYSPIVSIQDQGGATAAATATVAVAVAPLSASGLSLSGTEGTTLGGTLVDFSDPNSFASTSDFSAVINWGDGITSTGTIGFDSALNSFTVSGSHTYAQAGTYSPTVSIQDQGGATAAATATAVVADAPLTASGLTLLATEGSPFSGLVATFTDADPSAVASNFTALITWGDGHSSTGTIGYNAVQKTFTVSGSNTYTQAGSYRPAIFIHDLGGASALAIATATVADAPLIATGLNIIAVRAVRFTGVVATFIDVNPAESASSFTAKINWGAGQARLGKITQPGGPGTSFLVTGTHRYSRAGMATIKVSISEKSGIPSARTTGKVRVLSENPHRTNPRHPFIPRRRV